MDRRGPLTPWRAVLTTVAACLIIAPPALAIGVNVGGVNLPGSNDVPGVSVQVPSVPGPQVNVPQVDVPDPGGVGGAVDQVVPQVLPSQGGGGGGQTPGTPASPPTTAPPNGPSGPSGDGGSGATPGSGPGATSQGGGSGGNGPRSDGPAGDGPGRGDGGDGAGTATATPAGADAQSREGSGDDGRGSGEEGSPSISTRIGDVISELPSGILIGLIGLAVIGLLMTGRSAWFARATKRLNLQRRELQEDVGALQAALVPDLPGEIGGVGVAVAYRAATGPAAGGDFHDVFEIDSNTLGVVIGDVAGHGRDAVPRTGVVRYTIRAYLEAGLEPRLALRLADRALRGEFSSNGGDGGFATALAATYDRSAGRLLYASAGHPHPIVRGAVDASEFEPVEALNSSPIGVSGASGCRQTMLALAGETELWVFTDGLLEVRRDGEEEVLGREGLGELIAEHGDPDELIAGLEARDDLTACRLLLPEAESVEPFSVETLLIDRDHEPSEVDAFLAACGIAAHERSQAVERIAAESRFEGEILVRVSRLGSVQHVRVERIQPELGEEASTASPEAEPAERA